MLDESKQHKQHTEARAESGQGCESERTRRPQDFERVDARWTIRRPYLRPGSPFLYVPVWDGRARKLYRVSSGETIARRARAFSRAWIREQEARERQEPTSPSLTFERAYDEHLKLLDIRASTRHSYEADRNVYVRAFAGKLLTEIELADIERFLAKLKADGRSARTRRKHLTSIRGFFNAEQLRGHVVRNPTLGLKVARGEKKKGQALEIDEARRLLAACREAAVHEIKDSTGRRQQGSQSWNPPGHLQLAVLIALSTGLRRGNVTHLRWGQINLEKRKVTIPASEMKGAADHQVPITKELVEALTLRLKEQEKKLDRVPSNKDLVLGIEVTEITKSFKTALAKAELPESFRWHDTRHTYASWMSSRCSYSALRQLMGHSPGAVTLQYTHVPFAELLAAVDKLPPLLAPPEKQTEAGTPERQAVEA